MSSSATEGGPPPALDAALAGIMAHLESLGESLALVTGQLAAVASAQVIDRAAQRRTRHLAVGLVVSFVLDVSLTIAVTLLSVTALNQGSTLHSSQLAACAIGNQGRVAQQQLWGYLFQLSGGAKTTQDKQFLAFVDKTFTPVDCAKVYK